MRRKQHKKTTVRARCFSFVLRFVFREEKGVSILASTLVVLLLLITIGLSIASVGLLEGMTSESQRQSQEASLAAEAGVKDALIKIARNKNFSSTGYFIPSDPSNCTLNGAALCAKVIVEKGSSSVCSQSITAAQDCVIATGTMGERSRTIEAVLNINATNGKITQASWREL